MLTSGGHGSWLGLSQTDGLTIVSTDNIVDSAVVSGALNIVAGNFSVLDIVVAVASTLIAADIDVLSDVTCIVGTLNTIAGALNIIINTTNVRVAAALIIATALDVVSTLGVAAALGIATSLDVVAVVAAAALRTHRVRLGAVVHEVEQLFIINFVLSQQLGDHLLVVALAARGRVGVLLRQEGLAAVALRLHELVGCPIHDLALLVEDYIEEVADLVRAELHLRKRERVLPLEVGRAPFFLVAVRVLSLLVGEVRVLVLHFRGLAVLAVELVHALLALVHLVGGVVLLVHALLRAPLRHLLVVVDLADVAEDVVLAVDAAGRTPRVRQVGGVALRVVEAEAVVEAGLGPVLLAQALLSRAVEDHRVHAEGGALVLGVGEELLALHRRRHDLGHVGPLLGQVRGEVHLLPNGG